MVDVMEVGSTAFGPTSSCKFYKENVFKHKMLIWSVVLKLVLCRLCL